MTFNDEGFQGADSDGWQVRLRLDFAAGPDRTILAHREQRGPLAVQRLFYPQGSTCHVYVLHPPGGAGRG
jgi:urease accessory protein